MRGQDSKHCPGLARRNRECFSAGQRWPVPVLRICRWHPRLADRRGKDKGRSRPRRSDRPRQKTVAHPVSVGTFAAVHGGPDPSHDFERAIPEMARASGRQVQAVVFARIFNGPSRCPLRASSGQPLDDRFHRFPDSVHAFPCFQQPTAPGGTLRTSGSVQESQAGERDRARGSSSGAGSTSGRPRQTGRNWPWGGAWVVRAAPPRLRLGLVGERRWRPDCAIAIHAFSQPEKVARSKSLLGGRNLPEATTTASHPAAGPAGAGQVVLRRRSLIRRMWPRPMPLTSQPSWR